MDTQQLASSLQTENNKFIFDEFDMMNCKIACKKLDVREDLFIRLQKAIYYINSNLKTKLHIKDVARNCGMSEYHFSRTFKQAFGLSPYSYIIDNRLEEAYKMIVNENKSIAESAFECGFNDMSHFTRYFKKKYKYLPSKAKKYSLR